MPTMKTRVAAMQAAKELVGKMHTKGWKPRVHENTGWHYKIVLGGMAVFENAGIDGSKKYWTLLTHQPRAAGIGDSFWSNTDKSRSNGPKMFADPNDAVREQLRKADEFLSDCSKALMPFRNLLLQLDSSPKHRSMGR